MHAGPDTPQHTAVEHRVRELFACRPSDDLSAAQRVMREHPLRGLPVTDPEGKLLGIVSRTDTADAAERQRVAMRRAEAISGAVNRWNYQVTVQKDRAADHYTPRIVPYHPDAAVPLEASQTR
jgi:CBS domain-containing protein